jgi:hypothetical protein
MSTSVSASAAPVSTPHYDDTAVTIGSGVFLALLAAAVLLSRGGRRRR